MSKMSMAKNEYDLDVVLACDGVHYVTLYSPDGAPIQSWELGGDPCPCAIDGERTATVESGSRSDMRDRGPIVAESEADNFSDDGREWIGLGISE